MEKLKILIIDDDPTTGFLHRKLMEKFGVLQTVEIAYSGEEALQLIQYYSQSQNEDKIPQLIFVDLNMPFMDGYEFLNAYQSLEFKNKDSVVVTVLLTSYHPEDVEKVKEFPVVKEYVVKPLTEEKVMELMETHFRWNFPTA